MLVSFYEYVQNTSTNGAVLRDDLLKTGTGPLTLKRVRKIPTQPSKMKQKGKQKETSTHVGELKERAVPSLGEAPLRCGDWLGQRGTFGELEGSTAADLWK